MSIIKYFLIISIVIVTLCIGYTRPKLHKHIILTPASFKLQSNIQDPKNSQSTLLFKIGESNNTFQTAAVVSKTKKNNYYHEQRKNKIIPSSFYTNEATETENSLPVSNQTEVNTLNKNSVKNNSQAWKELEQQTHKINEIYKNTIAERKKNGSSANNGPNEELACPICEMLNEPQPADETIAWNKWRSDIQNRIMDDSDIDANLGTMFYFTFKVDKNGNISNINVVCTDFQNQDAVNKVKQAISNLSGKPILKFPRNTKRNIVYFKGSFLISFYSRYSSPSDYNDYERIKF